MSALFLSIGATGLRLAEAAGEATTDGHAAEHGSNGYIIPHDINEVIWGATLLGEEIPDRLQREMVEDGQIQPLMLMVNRIHIMEEARHISFAREELARAVARTPRWLRPVQRLLLAHIAFIISRSLVNPEVYRSVGLDPRKTRRIALANPNYQRTLRWASEKLVALFDEHDLISRPGLHWWKAGYLIR